MAGILKDKSKPPYGWIIILAGAVVAVVAIILFMGHDSDAIQITFVFDDLKNLHLGNSVKLRGMAIGEVIKIEMENIGNIQVGVRIDPDYTGFLSDDITARIERIGIINPGNQKMLSIYVGDKYAPPLQDGVTFKGMNSWVDLKIWQVTHW